MKSVTNNAVFCICSELFKKSAESKAKDDGLKIEKSFAKTCFSQEKPQMLKNLKF